VTDVFLAKMHMIILNIVFIYP